MSYLQFKKKEKRKKESNLKSPFDGVQARLRLLLAPQTPPLCIVPSWSLEISTGTLERKRPTQASLSWHRPAADFAFVPEKPKLVSLEFLFSGESALYLRKGLLYWGGGPILSLGAER